MTTLYHGTTIEAAQSIVENGFILTSAGEVDYNRDHDGACVYGFKDIDSAKDFIFDQGRDDQAVIAFEVDDAEMTLDPEYDPEDGAYIVTNPGEAKLIWTHDFGVEVNY